MFSHRTDWKLTPNRFTVAQQEMAKSGKEILDLSVSNPTRAGLHYEREAMLEALALPESLDYDPQPKGLIGARQAVSEYYRRQHDAFGVDAESMILTTSTSEGYSYVFRLLCNAEDEILVPKPSYPLFEFLADLQDVKLVPYPLIYDHGWQMDFPSLYKAVNHRTRAVVVVHPNNPTGSYANQNEQSSLNKFCNEHGLALIVDEVFLDYAHDGIRRLTFAANHQALTFTLSGLSKISAWPQMKLAWIASSGPAEQLHAAMQRMEVIADTYLSVNAPIQLAVPVFLEQRKKVQPFLLRRIQTNLMELDRLLVLQKSCVRLNVEGGWYAVLRVPVTQSDEDLAIAIMKNLSVLVHPGHFYDFSRDGYLVVSLITESKQFSEGVKRILDFLNQ